MRQALSFKTVMTSVVLSALVCVTPPALAGNTKTIVYSSNTPQGAKKIKKKITGYVLMQDLRANGRVTMRTVDTLEAVANPRRGNVALVEQTGSGHSASIRQSGTGHVCAVFQSGTGATANVVQTGHNGACMVLQHGSN